jgi:hypothetical protein
MSRQRLAQLAVSLTRIADQKLGPVNGEEAFRNHADCSSVQSHLGKVMTVRVRADDCDVEVVGLDLLPNPTTGADLQIATADWLGIGKNFPQ